MPTMNKKIILLTHSVLRLPCLAGETQILDLLGMLEFYYEHTHFLQGQKMNLELLPSSSQQMKESWHYMLEIEKQNKNKNITGKNVVYIHISNPYIKMLIFQLKQLIASFHLELNLSGKC